MSTSGPSNPARRRLLSRIGLGLGVVGAAYVAPAMLGLDAAQAAGRKSRGSRPRNSRPKNSRPKNSRPRNSRPRASRPSR